MAWAIIPARGGSKGIPHKNLVGCGGKPLVQWTLDCVEQAETIEGAVLSTDDPEIGALAGGKTTWLIRGPESSSDQASLEAVIEEIQPETDPWVLLQPTSPQREAWQVDEAVRLFESSGVDSLVSVVASHHLIWDGIRYPRPLYRPDARPRRQEMEQYEENGSIYIFSAEHWQRTGVRCGGRVILYPMQEKDAYQVDSPLDLRIMEHVLAEKAVVAAHGRLPQVRR